MITAIFIAGMVALTAFVFYQIGKHDGTLVGYLEAVEDGVTE
jgi:hypothetical protein